MVNPLRLSMFAVMVAMLVPPDEPAEVEEEPPVPKINTAFWIFPVRLLPMPDNVLITDMTVPLPHKLRFNRLLTFCPAEASECFCVSMVSNCAFHRCISVVSKSCRRRICTSARIGRPDTENIL